MRTVSAAVRALVRGPHRRVVEVTAHTAAGASKKVPVIDGAVSFNLSQGIGERSGRVILPLIDPDGTSWLPQSETSLVGVFGQYVTVRFGFDVPGKAREWVSLGEFPIIRVQVRRPAKLIELTLGDWAVRAEKNLWDADRQLATGTLGSIVDTWMSAVLPASAVTVSGSGVNNAVTTKMKVTAGTSVWASLTDLCADHNAQITVLSRSEVRLVDDPFKPPTGGPVETLSVGPGGVVSEITTEMDVLSMMNKVVTIHENTKTQRTYRKVLTLTTGPFKMSRTGAGEHDLIEEESSDTASQATADAHAKRLFERRVGVGRSIDLTCVPMPWLETGDVVQIGGLSSSEFGRVEAATFPFLPENLSTVRTRTYMNTPNAVPMRGGVEFFGADL